VLFVVGLFLTALFNRVMAHIKAALDAHIKAALDGNLQQLRDALTVDNVNASNCGWTALHYAALRGHADCVSYCIEMGANVNVRNNSGSTPLHSASYFGYVNVVRVLLDAGAIVDAFCDIGWTPLYSVICNKHNDVARLLIDRGAKVSMVKLYLTPIPDWVNTFIQSRSTCRCASITIIGIHKYHRTTMTGNNDINVIRLVSKHIWSTRMDDVWVTAPAETKKLRRNPKRGSKNK
jgi:ankyrin repeat protein